MAKLTTVYTCQQCGYKSSTYLGKCPQCDSWNSFVEEVEQVGRGAKAQDGGSIAGKRAEIVNLSEVDKLDYKRIDSGIGELNRVLGGGIVYGSLILVAGDPGIGKSTLLTQLALNINKSLYVAGEESARQIKIRVERIKQKANISVLNETDVDTIVGLIEDYKPSVVIIDSIQTLETQDLDSVAGSVGQVRESAHRLQRLAKRMHIPIFLVGHVTKEGTVAGPRTLEHLVDVVLSLEGDPGNQFRVLRATKNRFGSTDEVGIFEMEEGGMVEVKNPSKLFLDTKIDAPGSAVVVVMTGLRPLLVEIQALVTKTSLPVPRRTGSGVDNNRLQLLVAVLQKRLRLPLFDQDIFVNVTGGLKITEPAADLGICMAIASSFKDLTINPKTVFMGEVGLLGEIREVRNPEKRANEAKKLGFGNVVSFNNTKILTQAIKQLTK
ncbi:DNA repair protein RadA [Candidatus Daviesbacteria bacterium]|nr:DNA repair protein RadA [Candidatus Daviesbacteria bacterium]